MTSDVLGRKGYPGGKVLVFPVLSIARPLRLSSLVTFPPGGIPYLACCPALLMLL